MKRTKNIHPERILVIQTAFLGDAVLSTALIWGIREVSPDTKIIVLCIPQTKPVFTDGCHADMVLIFDKRRGWFRKLVSFFRLSRQLRRIRISAGISIQSSGTSGFLMVLSGIRRRIGFSGQIGLTEPVSFPPGIPRLERLGYLLSQCFGVDRAHFRLQSRLDIPTEAHRRVCPLMEKGIRIGIAPGSVRETKKWPEEYFARLISALSGLYSIFIVGGAEDYDTAERLRDQVRNARVDNARVDNARVDNMAGRLSIMESAALISRLDLLISNDSAPLHIANAVGTPVFAIFGPTVRDHGFFPYRERDRVFEIDLPCRPCGRHGGKRCPLRHFRCMRDILPETIVGEIRNFVAENP